MADTNIINQANELTQKSHYSMNTLNISFTYDFAVNTADLNWNDILFAINQGFLNHYAAVENARCILEGDNYTQAVLDLACLLPEEIICPHAIHPYIDDLAEMVDSNEKEKTQDKMLFVLLKWVYEGNVKLNDPYFNDILNIAELIWDDFNFTETIAHFAAWRNPPSFVVAPILDSIEKNRARLLTQWKAYLDEEQIIWKK